MDETIDLKRVICAVAEIGDPGARGFTLGEGEWPLRGFVVRRGDAIRAYVNHCPHAGFPLNWQPDVFLAPDGQLIRCIMHGALFEIETGDCVAGPCMGHGLQPLSIRVRDGYVLLDDDVPLEDPN
ncbi:MAG TPA: Rieske (2Fe-2S) protein [Steroidobacteraceae bacterium]|nr:Rieske (2Fe-2S) protein [Steroidobacteraceae bacterium]